MKPVRCRHRTRVVRQLRLRQQWALPRLHRFRHNSEPALGRWIVLVLTLYPPAMSPIRKHRARCVQALD